MKIRKLAKNFLSMSQNYAINYTAKQDLVNLNDQINIRPLSKLQKACTYNHFHNILRLFYVKKFCFHHK